MAVGTDAGAHHENAYPRRVSAARFRRVNLVTYDISVPRRSIIYKSLRRRMWVPTSVTFSFTAAGRGRVRSWRSGVSTPIGGHQHNQLNASSTTAPPIRHAGTPSTMLLALYTVANGTTDTLSNRPV